MFMPPPLNNPKLIGEEILSCLVLLYWSCACTCLRKKLDTYFQLPTPPMLCLNLDVVRRVIMYLLSSHVCARIRCIIAHHAPQYETIAWCVYSNLHNLWTIRRCITWVNGEQIINLWWIQQDQWHVSCAWKFSSFHIFQILGHYAIYK